MAHAGDGDRDEQAEQAQRATSREDVAVLHATREHHVGEHERDRARDTKRDQAPRTKGDEPNIRSAKMGMFTSHAPSMKKHVIANQHIVAMTARCRAEIFTSGGTSFSGEVVSCADSTGLGSGWLLPSPLLLQSLPPPPSRRVGAGGGDPLLRCCHMPSIAQRHILEQDRNHDPKDEPDGCHEPNRGSCSR